MSTETFFVLATAGNTVRYTHKGAYLNRAAAESFAAAVRESDVRFGFAGKRVIEVLSAREVNARYNGGMTISHL